MKVETRAFQGRTRSTCSRFVYFILRLSSFGRFSRWCDAYWYIFDKASALCTRRRRAPLLLFFFPFRFSSCACAWLHVHVHVHVPAKSSTGETTNVAGYYFLKIMTKVAIRRRRRTTTTTAVVNAGRNKRAFAKRGATISRCKFFVDPAGIQVPSLLLLYQK